MTSGPKGMDGLKLAKRDLKLSLRCIKDFAEIAMASFEEDRVGEVMTAVHALLPHAGKAMQHTGEWRTLLDVKAGTLKDPKDA